MNFIHKIFGKSKETKGITDTQGSGNYLYGSSADTNTISKEECLTQNKAFIYICTKLVSQNCSAVPLRLYASTKSNQKQVTNFQTKDISRESFNYLKKTRVSQLRQSESVVEILNHPILDLLYSPNPDSNYDSNFLLTYNYLDLVGNSYWYIEKDSNGTPSAIYQLRPDLIEVVPGANTGLIKGYLYNRRKLAFHRDEVIRYNYVNPSCKWYGLGVIEAMSVAVKRNNKADEYETGRLQNNARPDFLVKYKQTLDIQQQRELDLSWNKAMRGPKNTGRVKIMGSDFDIEKLSMTPQEMQYLQGRVVTQKEICSAFGIPYSVIDTTDSKKAGLDITEKLFQKNAISPRLKIVENTLNDQLIPMYDDSGSLFLAFDDPVKEDAEFNLKREESRLKTGVLTIDEVRQMNGLNNK